MQGIDVPAQKGIIPRAFEHIFESIATTKNKKFLVHASYLEVNNLIYDSYLISMLELMDPNYSFKINKMVKN